LTAVAFLTGDFLGEAFFLGGMPPKPIYAHSKQVGGQPGWSVSRGRGGWVWSWGGPRTHGRRGGWSNPDPTGRHTEETGDTRTQRRASSSAPQLACRPGAPLCGWMMTWVKSV
jgi:hypothetical protein